MSEERKKEVLINALKAHLRNCEKLARRYPEFPAFRKDAEDVRKVLEELLVAWTD